MSSYNITIIECPKCKAWDINFDFIEGKRCGFCNNTENIETIKKMTIERRMKCELTDLINIPPRYCKIECLSCGHNPLCWVPMSSIKNPLVYCAKCNDIVTHKYNIKSCVHAHAVK